MNIIEQNLMGFRLKRILHNRIRTKRIEMNIDLCEREREGRKKRQWTFDTNLTAKNKINTREE